MKTGFPLNNRLKRAENTPGWCHARSYRASIYLSKFFSWKLFPYIQVGPGVESREKIEKKDIWLSKYRKKIMAVLYNCTTTNRMQTGLSLNNGPKRVETKSFWHHAPIGVSQISDLNLSCLGLFWKKKFT